MAQRGSDVLVTYRSRAAEAEAFVAELSDIGRRAEAVQCDVTDRAQVDAVFGRAQRERRPGPHHRVGRRTRVRDRPIGGLQCRIVSRRDRHDVLGFFNIAQAGIPVLRAGKGGFFVALITCATKRTVPMDALSATPKSAVEMLVRQIATEEASNDIRANAVGPGVIDGGMVTPMMETQSRELLEKAVEFTPLGRLGLCEQIAEVAAFLASSKAAHITGQSLMVDGGLSA